MSIERRVVEAARGDLAEWSTSGSAVGAAFDYLSCVCSGDPELPPARPGIDLGPSTTPSLAVTAGLYPAIARNATAAHKLDRDDLHWPTEIHAGSVVWPVAFAVGELCDSAVDEVLAAGAFGYQMAGRASKLLGPGHRKRFHVSTTGGTIAAAAVAAALADGSDSDSVISAVSGAASVIGGSRQAVFELSDTAALHRAHAAVNGVLAWHLGTERPVREALSGELGLAWATGVPLESTTLTDPMSPVIDEVSVRLHPVCGYAHTMVDALATLGPIEPRLIRSIRVELPVALLAAHREQSPSDSREAAWNFKWVAALAVTGKLPVRRLPWPLPQNISPLLDRIELVGVDDLPDGSLECHVFVRLADAELTATRCRPHGDPTDPLSRSELVARSDQMGAFVGEDEALKVFRSLEDGGASIRSTLAVAVAAAKPDEI